MPESEISKKRRKLDDELRKAAEEAIKEERKRGK
jgi:hypothetical protein